MKNLFDIHSHILPHVDDGAKNMDMALKMIQMEYDDGVRSIILTPHFRREMFETPQEKIEQQFKILKAKAEEKIGMDLQLYLGCEFHANMSMVDTLLNKERPTMAGSGYVLTEFSGATDLAFARERVYELVTHGFIPIIAHVERYPNLRKDMGSLETLREIGAYLQVNAESILGEEGFAIKRFCKKLMKNNMLDFVGTDCHRTNKRIPNLGSCAEYMEKKMGREYTERILVHNPQKIIENIGWEKKYGNNTAEQ